MVLDVVLFEDDAGLFASPLDFSAFLVAFSTFASVEDVTVIRLGLPALDLLGVVGGVVEPGAVGEGGSVAPSSIVANDWEV